MVDDGLNNAIREVLAEAEDSLSAHEVNKVLRAKGYDYKPGRVSTRLRDRAIADELIRGFVDGRIVYTLNPGYKPKRGKATPASILAPSLGAAAIAQKTDAEPGTESPRQWGEMPREELMRIADSIDVVPVKLSRDLDELTPISAEHRPPAGPHVRSDDPVGLQERLFAIGSDIEDALGDACDARLPHQVIKGLVLANGAIARASRLLGA